MGISARASFGRNAVGAVADQLRIGALCVSIEAEFWNADADAADRTAGSIADGGAEAMDIGFGFLFVDRMAARARVAFNSTARSSARVNGAGGELHVVDLLATALPARRPAARAR